MTTGGKSYYYLTDALGSLVALAYETGTKANSYSYSLPTASQRAGASGQVPQPDQFAGGHHDVSGLYHFAARYYAPNIGRFTQPDPSGQEKNPYPYAEGNPVNRIDPYGSLSLNGVMDTVDKTGDAIAVGEFVGQLVTGDYKAAAGTALSFAADKTFTAGCTGLTGGAGAIPCAVGGIAVGEATESAHEDATS
ncbi:RHS repeat-associated core domain-containing protein [Streptomyces filamentosus]|uniref:RHS repeat-associated core domain-containing protein n=1 Tax=Streptomyces filamentosus TaxID=67294 RepID=UPI0033324110